MNAEQCNWFMWTSIMLLTKIPHGRLVQKVVETRDQRPVGKLDTTCTPWGHKEEGLDRA